MSDIDEVNKTVNVRRKEFDSKFVEMMQLFLS